jgi:hypothetical protein
MVSARLSPSMTCWLPCMDAVLILFVLLSRAKGTKTIAA